MKRGIFIWFAAVVTIGCLVGSSSADARGRQSSPFIKTPFGLIPKSVYNQGFVNNPAKLEQYRQREQQMMKQQGNTKGNTRTTGGKSTTTVKKKP